MSNLNYFIPANNVVIRDCFTTAIALNYKHISEIDCAEKEGVKCNFCKTPNCNIMEPRNSGVKIYGSLLAFAAVIVTKYF